MGAPLNDPFNVERAAPEQPSAPDRDFFHGYRMEFEDATRIRLLWWETAGMLWFLALVTVGLSVVCWLPTEMWQDAGSDEPAVDGRRWAPWLTWVSVVMVVWASVYTIRSIRRNRRGRAKVT